MIHYVLGIAILLTSVVAHWTIQLKRDQGLENLEDDAVISLPARIGSYRQVGDDIDPGDTVREVLETSSILMRYYAAPNGLPVLLTVVQAGETRRSLHFPEVCLVGQGWEVEQAYAAPVGIEFRGRRLVIIRGDKKEAVLYWFKTGDEHTGSAFINALWWGREQLTFGTATSSMIKLSIPVRQGDSEAEAFAILDDFATRLVPVVDEHIE